MLQAAVNTLCANLAELQKRVKKGEDVTKLKAATVDDYQRAHEDLSTMTEPLNQLNQEVLLYTDLVRGDKDLEASVAQANDDLKNLRQRWLEVMDDLSRRAAGLTDFQCHHENIDKTLRSIEDTLTPLEQLHEVDDITGAQTQLDNLSAQLLQLQRDELGPLAVLADELEPLTTPVDQSMAVAERAAQLTARVNKLREALFSKESAHTAGVDTLKRLEELLERLEPPIVAGQALLKQEATKEQLLDAIDTIATEEPWEESRLQQLRQETLGAKNNVNRHEQDLIDSAVQRADDAMADRAKLHQHLHDRVKAQQQEKNALEALNSLDELLTQLEPPLRGAEQLLTEEQASIEALQGALDSLTTDEPWKERELKKARSELSRSTDHLPAPSRDKGDEALQRADDAVKDRKELFNKLHSRLDAENKAQAALPTVHALEQLLEALEPPIKTAEGLCQSEESSLSDVEAAINQLHADEPWNESSLKKARKAIAKSKGELYPSDQDRADILIQRADDALKDRKNVLEKLRALKDDLKKAQDEADAKRQNAWAAVEQLRAFIARNVPNVSAARDALADVNGENQTLKERKKALDKSWWTDDLAKLRQTVIDAQSLLPPEQQTAADEAIAQGDDLSAQYEPTTGSLEAALDNYATLEQGTNDASKIFDIVEKELKKYKKKTPNVEQLEKLLDNLSQATPHIGTAREGATTLQPHERPSKTVDDLQARYDSLLAAIQAKQSEAMQRKTLNDLNKVYQELERQLKESNDLLNDAQLSKNMHSHVLPPHTDRYNDTSSEYAQKTAEVCFGTFFVIGFYCIFTGIGLVGANRRFRTTVDMAQQTRGFVCP